MKKSRLVVILLLLATVACAPLFAAGGAETKGGKQTVYYVPKFTGFIFFELAGAGAKQACDELGLDMVTLGPTQNDVEVYVQTLQNLVPQKPQIIVTTSSDANAPVPALKTMKANGATIVTFDSPVGKGGQDLYVNMAPYRVQAIAELESALYNNPKGGKVIWLAPSPNITLFNKVKESLDELVATVPKYKVFQFIDTLYMEDDPDKSYSVATSAMEAHPDLAGFITSSGMANPAVNKAIQDTGRVGKVFCTGMALPSTMETFLNDGVNKQYALWSPYWFGYMSTYLAIKVHRGEIQVKDGNVVDIPNVGKRKMYMTPDGVMYTDLNMMLFFRKGNSDWDTAIPMPPELIQ
jgi:rhamnose transport system substrate-binding protein